MYQAWSSRLDTLWVNASVEIGLRYGHELRFILRNVRREVGDEMRLVHQSPLCVDVPQALHGIHT